MKLKFIALGAVLVSCIIASCTNNNKQDILAALDPCDTTSVSYSSDIKPILDQFCNTSGCHNASSMASGYNFENYNVVKNTALGNRFLGTIRHESGFSPMPKGTGKLTDCQIQQIENWIAQGAPNN